MRRHPRSLFVIAAALFVATLVFVWLKPAQHGATVAEAATAPPLAAAVSASPQPQPPAPVTAAATAAQAATFIERRSALEQRAAAGDAAAARRRLQQVREQLLALVSADSRVVAELWVDIAAAELAQGHEPEAAAALQHALPVLETEPASRAQALALRLRGELAQRRGEPVATWFTRALASAEQSFPPDAAELAAYRRAVQP